MSALRDSFIRRSYMNHQVTSQKAKTILTLLFILLAVCLLSGVPTQAAGISMSDVTTSSGG